MAFKGVRSSKFRHVFGTAYKKDKCYDNIKLTKAPWESNMSDVNGKFLAVVLESQGGGAFFVSPLEKSGRFDLNHPKVCGHTANVLDLAWNPFDDNMIASCSEDCTIKIWQIPDGGLTSNLEQETCTLEAHQRKVGCIAWHPTAENIIASAGYDGLVIVWNLETCEPCHTIEIPETYFFSISWNDNGSLLCVTCKDKKLRIIDPRSEEVVAEGQVHEGGKPMKAVFCGSYIFSTGFSKMNDRQYALWNPKNLQKPLTQENIDNNSGVQNLFYDRGTRMVYLVGKGDNLLRYYEITDSAPYVHFLTMYNGPYPRRGACAMPKRHLNFMDCETMRLYTLTNKGLVEPISFTVPRKSAMFQDDIYPPCYAGIPSLSADEWLQGQNKEPMMQKITKDGLGTKSGGGVSTSKLAPSGLSSSGNISKQSSVSSSASDLKIERENSPISLTASGDFDDSGYRREIESLKGEVNALKQEIASLKDSMKKKDSIISSIKQLVN